MWETRSVFHISMPLLLRQDGLRCRRPVAQRRVRPLRVVFHAPPLRQNLCLLQRVKDLAVQELIAQLAVEALTVPVFPWASSLDVQHPGADFPQPFPQLVSDELRAVIGADVLRDPAPQHYVGQMCQSPPGCPVVVPLAAPGTPACTRRSASEYAAFSHHGPWR